MRHLYTFFRSSTSHRLRIALALKGIAYQPHYVSLPKMEHRSAAYLALNPQGLVPALVEEDGTVLAQSLAQLEYLDEAYPAPPLLPQDAKQRAYVRMLAQIVGCDMHPLNNTRVRQYLGQRWHLSEQNVTEWCSHWIAEGLWSFEQTLLHHRLHGQFCLGDEVGLADICLVPQVANARRFACDIGDYPLLAAIAERAAVLPAFRAAAPEAQPDAT